MIREQLRRKLVEWRPEGAPTEAGRYPWTHHLAEQGWNAFLTAQQVDTLGAQLWDLSVARTQLQDATPEGLRGWADRVARKATGLMEPLRVLEVDATRMEAVLRSDAPAPQGDQGVAYYEVRLLGTSRAELRRYEARPLEQSGRRQVGYSLTHEAIAKLFADLISEA